ncbi:MAG: VCBS repeat-containing protein [Thermoanaerobaculia bacterium]
MRVALAICAALAAVVWVRTAIGGSVGAGGDPPPRATETVALARPQRPVTLEDKLAARADPAADGWPTEILSGAADVQLKALGRLIESPGRIDADQLSALVADRFSSSALRPLELRQVFDDGVITVRRWKQTPAAVIPVYRQAQGLAEALNRLKAGLGSGGTVPVAASRTATSRVALQLVRIEASDTLLTTRVLFEASRRGARSGIQQNATWRCRWQLSAGQRPRLLSIELEGYEEVEVAVAGGALFAVVTESVLGANAAYRQQVLPGIGHWLGRVSRLSGMSLFGHHGLAVGDVDGDGLDDLYTCDAGGLPNRLYLQNLDGTVTDVSAAAGVDWLESSSSALLVDLDNDGDQDLVVATQPLLLLAENDGHGRFTLRAAEKAVVVSATSLTAADYDLDGDLDLYLCGYDGDRDPRDLRGSGLPGPFPYHDANNGGANVLLRNDGDFSFSDVTRSTGLDQNNSRYSFAAAWEDVDNDGDPDLYVANDFGRNNLYRNDGGRFVDVAPEAGVEDLASGMSVTWGDVDRDGWMDLYVSNMYSSAGSRISYQRQFTDRAGDRGAALQRMARGNTLFLNTRAGGFRDVSESAGVTTGRWAWASKLADLNNDGWPDLAVANGYLSNDDSDDL